MDSIFGNIDPTTLTEETYERRTLELMPVASSDPSRAVRILNLRNNEHTTEGDTVDDVFIMIAAIKRAAVLGDSKRVDVSPLRELTVEGGLIPAL